MKKPLIVSMLLVLCWAPLTQATLSLYLEGYPADRWFLPWGPGWPLEVQVHSDGTSPWAGYIVVDDYGVHPEYAILFDPLTMPAAGDQGHTQPYDEPGFGTGFRMVTDGTGVETGFQHEFTFVAGVWIYFISLWDEALGFDAPVDYVGIYVGADPHGPLFYAEADGPYQIGPGETIVLSGWHSFWVYEWHWSIGGQYIGQGDILPISYDTLVNDFGLSLGTHEVELRVAGEGVAYDYTTIDIIPEPATVLLFALGVVLLRRTHCNSAQK